MDSLVRAEFERKDEAIRTLHSILETQVRALQAGIKQEEVARNQFEAYQREEVNKFSEDVKKVMASLSSSFDTSITLDKNVLTVIIGV